MKLKLAQTNPQEHSPQKEKPLITFQEFYDTYYLPYIQTHIKSYETNISIFKNHILSEKGGEDTDGMDQEEYLDSNPLEETIEDNKGNSFDAGGSAKEEEYKLRYCLDNLDILHKKYSDLYDELISSDIYKIVNEDQNSKHRELLGAILTELNIAINNLETYIEK